MTDQSPTTTPNSEAVTPDFAEAAQAFKSEAEDQRVVATRRNMLSDLDSFADAHLAQAQIRQDRSASSEDIFDKAQAYRNAEQKMNASVAAYVNAMVAAKQKEN